MGYVRLTKFSVMMLDGRMLCFTSAAIIRHLSELLNEIEVRKGIKERKKWGQGMEIQNQYFPVEFFLVSANRVWTKLRNHHIPIVGISDIHNSQDREEAAANLRFCNLYVNA
jgi:hypothetical protein